MAYEVIALPGDGIGREVVPATIEVLQTASDAVEFDYHPFGEDSIERYAAALTPGTLRACQEADAVLFGSAGDQSVEGLLTLREEMGLYTNLRRIRVYLELQAASPLREDIVAGTDILMVRELTGGIYFGDKGRDRETGHAWDTCTYSRVEVERIARVAFEAATDKVTSVDYGDQLATSWLWRKVVTEVGREYDMPLEHLAITEECRTDSSPSAIRQLLAKPTELDVVVTENMLGDITSDMAAMISGSIGLLPSASVGEPGDPGLFEPVHGSAPDIAGQGIANPLATFLSGAMMLRHLGRDHEADAVEAAVAQALQAGLRTYDLGGTATTREATDAVLEYL